MGAEGKLFLLEALSEARLRDVAGKWRVAIEDQRLRAPGVARLLSRKRSVTVTAVLSEMSDTELNEALRRVGLPQGGPPEAKRTRLATALDRATPRALRREAAARNPPLVTLAAKLVRVIDGDTLLVEREGASVYVRLRGVDTPETHASDKAEEDLDRSDLTDVDLYALGERATARVRALLHDAALFLECQPTPTGPKEYLHHRQHRLLAFVRIGAPSGADLGEVLLREGYALVWPRGLATRRYLHRESQAYVQTCHAALEKRPGLWRDGLQRLCPSKANWSLEDCYGTCWRQDWREMENA